MDSAHMSTSALYSWLKYMSEWVLWTLAGWAAKVLAVSISDLVLVLVDGLMSYIGFFSGLVCPVRLLILLFFHKGFSAFHGGSFNTCVLVLMEADHVLPEGSPNELEPHLLSSELSDATEMDAYDQQQN